MKRQIYVNLPVKDVKRSMAFFEALGFGFERQYTDEKQAACVIIGENIYAMLLSNEYFATFATKPVADATKTTEVLICISCDTREDVDAMVAKALAHGGSAPRPSQDHGFMYQHAFEDPDGHVWELVAYAQQPAA